MYYFLLYGTMMKLCVCQYFSMTYGSGDLQIKIFVIYYFRMQLLVSELVIGKYFLCDRKSPDSQGDYV